MIDMNKKISNYDIKRLEMMQQSIINYKKAKLSLKNLIDDLESLFDALEFIKEEWKKLFIIEWGKLEIVYSSMIYNKKKDISIDDKKDVDDAIQNIEKLITEVSN